MASPTRLDRALIRVSGPDAPTLLQGLLTQDLDRLGDAPLYAALLSPQGKIVCDMNVWAEGDGVLIEADPTRDADLLRRLSMYKLRAQAEVADVSAELGVVFSFEDGAPDPRRPDGALGRRRIAPRGEVDALALEAGAYNDARIALGVPDLAIDAAPEEIFALEGLLEELNGVDFKKGCFVGQENVSRMKRRATTRKKFCPIVFEGPTPAFGAPVRAGEAELGSVRSGVAGRALALLRLDRVQEIVAQGGTLSVDGRPVRIDPPAWLILPSDKGET